MSKRRSHGEGSVFKRKDGLWVGQVTVQGKHISKYFKSQKAARGWLDETRNRVRDGYTLLAAQITIENYLENWLATHKSSIRQKTAFQYLQIIRRHVVPVLGKVKLMDLRPDQIQALYNAKLKAGVSPRTVQLIHAVLRVALNQALRWDLIGRNPVRAVICPKYAKKEMCTFTAEQVKVLLSAVKGSRFEALFWLAVTAGLREGELLGLKWPDIDWKSRRLKIQRQVQRLDRIGIVFSEPKSAKSRRVILLSQKVMAKLGDHVHYQEKEKLFAGDRWKDNDLIFPSSIGTPLDPRNFYENYRLVLRKAGLPLIRFHDLRHTAATLMLQEGVHPKIVQERLGHADINLTLNTYSHVLPDLQLEAAEKLDRLLE